MFVYSLTEFVSRNSFCHPRRLSPTFLIGDPIKGRIQSFFFVCKENDTGFPITNVGNDKRRFFAYQWSTNE